ncbi:MAG: DUF3999 domain-containing protein [Rudaea sp.]
MKLALTLLCLSLSASADAASADDYAYAWPLQTPGDSSAWQVDLTPEVYAAVRSADLRDVEVVNAAGESVPMAPRTVQFTTPTANDVDLPLFVLPPATESGAGSGDALQLHIERDANGRLRRLDTVASAAAGAPANADIVLDANALDAGIESLWLDWDHAADVNARFDVGGSDDLQQWRPLAANAVVMSVRQGGSELARHRIVLNGARAKYLRLHRLDAGSAIAELHVRAHVLARSTLIQPARVWVDAQPLPAPAEENPAPGTSSFRYRLPAPLAVAALKLELATDNSLAHVRVSSGAPHVLHADFTAFRLRQDGAVLANDEIEIAPTPRTQDWVVESATPLDHAPTLRVAFRPDRFVFLAQGGGPYRLVAGSARAHRGDYPVDAALAQLRAKFGSDWQPPLATLGERATLLGVTAYTPAPAPTHRDWKTWLLWSVLVGGAALIGALAVSLLRKQ